MSEMLFHVVHCNVASQSTLEVNSTNESLKQLTLSFPKCTKAELLSSVRDTPQSVGLYCTALNCKDRQFFYYKFGVFFFFSVEKVIWKHDSSSVLHLVIGFWKERKYFLLASWCLPGVTHHTRRKSNLIGLNFEVTKSLHTTRIILSFCSWNHTLISTKTVLKSGWLKELIWWLLYWRVRQ